jgi:hypothetical protein
MNFNSAIFLSLLSRSGSARLTWYTNREPATGMQIVTFELRDEGSHELIAVSKVRLEP